MKRKYIFITEDNELQEVLQNIANNLYYRTEFERKDLINHRWR